MPPRSREKGSLLSTHHKALTQFLNVSTERDSNNSPTPKVIGSSRARDKLLHLTLGRFCELSTDVYDELKRRIDESREGPNYLLPVNGYHIKRNQARKKLSALPSAGFTDLVSDISFEIERRIPNLRAYDGNSDSNGNTKPEVNSNCSSSSDDYLSKIDMADHKFSPDSENFQTLHEPNNLSTSAQPPCNIEEFSGMVSTSYESDFKHNRPFSIDSSSNAVNNNRDLKSPLLSRSTGFQTSTIVPKKSTLIGDSDFDSSDYNCESEESTAEFDNIKDTPASGSFDLQNSPKRKKTFEDQINESMMEIQTNFNDMKLGKYYNENRVLALTPRPADLSALRHHFSIPNPYRDHRLQLDSDEEFPEFSELNNIAKTGFEGFNRDQIRASHSYNEPDNINDNKDREIRTLLEEGTRMDLKITELENKISELQEEKISFVDAFTNKSLEINDLEENYQEKLSTAKEDFNKLTIEHNNLLKEKENWNNDLTDLNNNILNYENQIKVLNDKLSELKNANIDINDKNEKLKSLLLISKNQIKDFEKNSLNDNNLLKREYEKLEISNKNLNSKLSEAIDKLNQHEKNKDLNPEIITDTSMDIKMESLQIEANSWRSKYEALRSNQLNQNFDTYQEVDSINSTTLNFQKHNNFENYSSPDGMVSRLSLVKFQVAVENYLINLRSSNEENLLKLLGDLMLTIRKIIEDVETKTKGSQGSLAIKEMVSLVSASANHLITATRYQVTSSQFLPFFIVDSAVADLSFAVTELLKVVKIVDAVDFNYGNIDNNNVNDNNSKLPKPSELNGENNDITSGLRSFSTGTNRTKTNGRHIPIKLDYSAAPLNNSRTPQSSSVLTTRRSRSSGDNQNDNFNVLNKSMPGPLGSLTSHINGNSHYIVADNHNADDFSIENYDIEDPDNTIPDLLLYLEHQCSNVIDTVQQLLHSIKAPTSKQGTLTIESFEINEVVDKIVEATSVSMEQSRHYKLKEHGRWVLDSLSESSRRMKNISNDKQGKPDDYPDKQFKQRLAGVAFDIAKSTKELVKTVEEVNNSF